MAVGIYGIFDNRNNECLYVGQSKQVTQRWKGHLAGLVNETHIRTEFIEWFVENNKDESILDFRLLEECVNDIDVKNEHEIKWFEILKPRFYARKPSKNDTWVFDEATRDKIRIRSLNKGMYDEQIVKMYTEDNMSLREIAQIVPYSRAGILNVLKRLGVESKSPGFQSSLEKAARGKRMKYIPPRPCKICAHEFTPKKWNYYTCSQDCSFELLSINNSSEGRAEYAQHVAEVDLDYLRELHNDKSKSIEVKLYLTDLRVKEYKELTKDM